jgi:hypothetical protein
MVQAKLRVSGPQPPVPSFPSSPLCYNQSRHSRTYQGRSTMNPQLNKLLEKLTPAEQAEVATFAAYLLSRRSLGKKGVLSDEISTGELTQLVLDSGGFDWLDAPEEDVYSPEDGSPVQWPAER